MEKNIAVTDMQGRVYEATYPKRARGLVRKGRARFVDEFTICLAGPPDRAEDDKMDYESSRERGQIEQMQESRRQSEELVESLRRSGDKVPDSQLDMFQAALGQIEQLLRNTGYLEKALENVMEAGGDSDTLEAIVNIVQLRENTNMRMVDSAMNVLEKMLEGRTGEN